MDLMGLLSVYVIESEVYTYGWSEWYTSMYPLSTSRWFSLTMVDEATGMFFVAELRYLKWNSGGGCSSLLVVQLDRHHEVRLIGPSVT